MPKTFADAATLVWRAVVTPRGVVAAILALAVVARLERLTLILLADHPNLIPYLNPWLSYACAFAAGIQITRAVQDQIRLSHIPELIPARELLEPAEKLGWNMKGDTSLDILDFGRAMQQSALDGSLTIWGRSGPAQFEETWGPLEKIPPEHFSTYEVWALALFSDNNADVITKGGMYREEAPYFDLHVDRRPALRWLKEIAPRERGKRAKLEAKREEMRKENKNLREQAKRERQADESQTPRGPHGWMG